MQGVLPKYIYSKSIGLYALLVILCSMLFFHRAPSLIFTLIHFSFVLIFFYYTYTLSRQWILYTEKTFKKKIFWIGFWIRIAWVIISYYFYMSYTGTPFEFEAADVLSYHGFGQSMAELDAGINVFKIYSFALDWGIDFADSGQNVSMAVIYGIFGVNVIIPRIIYAIIGSWSSLFIYELTKRHFGENTGRLAAIMSMLFGTTIFYAGMHLKEVWMFFLVSATLERADYLFSQKKFNILLLLLVFFLGASHFLFRTILGASFFFTFFTVIMFSTPKKYTWKRRSLVGVWMLVGILTLFSGRIEQEIRFYLDIREDATEAIFEARSDVDAGRNAYFKYLAGGVLAPMITIVPFPTLVMGAGNPNMVLQAGNLFQRNILGFLTLVGLLVMIKTKGEWRKHILLYCIFIYILMIATTGFVVNNRFHIPIMPVLIIWAAYGITHSKPYLLKKYFNIYTIVLFVIIMGWNFLKMKGRGGI